MANSRHLQAHDAPEMAPAMEWIDNYLEESRLLAANVSFSDPAIGRLLAFGWTADYKHQNRHPEAHKIVAFAGGRTGSDLGTLPCLFVFLFGPSRREGGGRKELTFSFIVLSGCQDAQRETQT